MVVWVSSEANMRRLAENRGNLARLAEAIAARGGTEAASTAMIIDLGGFLIASQGDSRL